ncbi:helix-turn-helix domain-containing protein [Roseomonas sp. CAU 1739]|uniref:helix-turn-helix domain-containing protein n=1 Tax=Roseomonas sp. CAU 1739 TaxID=3140364 RepID=UPI00325BC309
MRTLRDWVHRYTAEGLAGLSDRPRRTGPRRRLCVEQEAQVTAWMEAAPDSVAHGGLMGWPRTDLRDLIAREFGVAFHERSIGELLARLNFSHMSVRPPHQLSDEAALGLAGHRADHRRLLPRLERPRPRTTLHLLHRITRIGTGQQKGRWQ